MDEARDQQALMVNSPTLEQVIESRLMTHQLARDSAYDVLSDLGSRDRRARVIPVIEGSPHEDASGGLLSYRAACPACGGWFPRRMIWRLLPTAVYHCQRCAAAVRPNQLWCGNAVLTSLFSSCFFAVAFGGLPAGLGIAGFVSALALVHVSFPYCTLFDLIDPAPANGWQAPQIRSAEGQAKETHASLRDPKGIKFLMPSSA